MKKIIKLVRRARKKNTVKSFLPVYDICVVNVNKKRGKKVFEKLGVYNTRGYTKLNIFRFIYWVSQGVRMSGNAIIKLEFLHILRLV